MHRLKLSLDSIRVESFPTTPFRAGVGTVAAYQEEPPLNTVGPIVTCEPCEKDPPPFNTVGPINTCEPCETRDCPSNQATCDTCQGPNCNDPPAA
jgi:hypothetical protein